MTNDFESQASLNSSWGLCEMPLYYTTSQFRSWVVYRYSHCKRNTETFKNPNVQFLHNVTLSTQCFHSLGGSGRFSNLRSIHLCHGHRMAGCRGGGGAPVAWLPPDFEGLYFHLWQQCSCEAQGPRRGHVVPVSGYYFLSRAHRPVADGASRYGIVLPVQ